MTNRDDEWRAEVDAWARGRHERLVADYGWLSLSGRWPLDPGDPVDTDVGRFTLVDDGVRFEATRPVTLRGDPVSTAILVPDRDTLEEGRRRWEVARIGGVVIVRVRDPDRPERTGFPGVRRFPVDPAWRIEARLVRDRATSTFHLAHELGPGNDRSWAGRLVFRTPDGVDRSLEAVWEGEGRVFVLFADETSGRETYGAGRFLYAKVEADRAVLDFNKAFNPPCALTPYASCPLVPEENRLPVRIPAGELAPVE